MISNSDSSIKIWKISENIVEKISIIGNLTANKSAKRKFKKKSILKVSYENHEIEKNALDHVQFFG